MNTGSLNFAAWVFVLGLGFLVACNQKDENTGVTADENSQPNQSFVTGEVVEKNIRAVFLRRSQAGEPLTAAERARFETFVREDPVAAWDLIEGLEDGLRRFEGTLFFRTLANHDPKFAAQLLPENASMIEKVDWISVICTAAVSTGNLELSQKLLNENFRGGGRGLAMGRIFPDLFNSGVEASTALELWSLIEPNGEKDSFASSFAELLVAKDPVAALDWYSRIERPEEKSAALRGMPAHRPEDIRNQIQATADAELLSLLASNLGTRLGALQGDIDAYLSSVPEDLVDDVEVAYVQGLGVRMGGGPVMELVEEYAKNAVTLEAKDRVRFMIASSEFSKDPKAALEQVRDDELAKRNPADWEAMLGRWLRLDSIQASEYISGLEGDGVYASSVQVMVKYLKRAGHQDEAKEWEEHLRERSQEN